MSRNLKIFLVDDDADYGAVLKASMEQAGHHVFSSISPIFAITEILTVKPDCILVDLMMAGMDGIACCHELKRRPELKNTKIILISAKSGMYWNERALAAGAAGFVSKQLAGAGFIEEIIDIVEGAETRRPAEAAIAAH